VSEVYDPKHTKDDCQAEGENDIDRTQDEPVKKLHDDKLYIHLPTSF
jgi:hypothetical protein